MKIVTGPRIAERAQLRNSYILREFSLENEAVKQVQRDRVRDHFFKHHPKSPMRLFSLPGAWWTFERQVEDIWRHGIDFVAIEKNYSILTHGATWMPGLGRHRPAEPLRDEDIQGYATDKARVLWCQGNYFMDLGRTKKMNNLGRRQWRNRYKKWTCAWWDFTSPICDHTLLCLRRCGSHMSMTQKTVPFAVTFLMGREKRSLNKIARSIFPDDGPEWRRAKFVQSLCNQADRFRQMEFTDVSSYKSAGGATMLLMLGLSHQKEITR